MTEKDIDPNDISLFNRFIPSTTSQSHVREQTRRKDDNDDHGTNLADLILEKIAAHEATQIDRPFVQGHSPLKETEELPPKVVEVYSKYDVLKPFNSWRAHDSDQR